MSPHIFIRAAKNAGFKVAAVLTLPILLSACMAELMGPGGAVTSQGPVADIVPRLVATSPSIYSKPRGITLSASGQYLFVADQGNSVIQVLDSFSLGNVGTIGENRLIDPFDVHVDSRGRLIVADTGNNRVLTFIVSGTNGRFEKEYNQRMQQPEGLTVTRSGRLVVTNGGSDSLTVIQNDQVNEQLTRLSETQLRLGQPKDAVVNRLGNLIVSDTRNRRILIMDENLNPIRTLEGATYGFREPFDLAIGDDGWLYVADALANQIQVYDELFQLRGTIGTGARGVGQGQLSRPEGIAVRGNSIYIADTDNNRILKYERN